jgi:hypothetical protein
MNNFNSGENNTGLNEKLIVAKQIANLIYTYLIFLVQMLKIVFCAVYENISTILLNREKSIKNEIVLITGAGGYLGNFCFEYFNKKFENLKNLNLYF